MLIATNPFLYIYFHSQKNSFLIADLFYKKHFQLKDASLFKLLEFTRKGESMEKIKNYFRTELKIDRSFDKAISDLISKRILLKMDNNLKNILKVKKMWDSYGWASAFYYHLYSRDYPFLNYNKSKSFLTDQNLMRKYLHKSKIPLLYKVYKNKKFYKLVINEKLLNTLKFWSNNEVRKSTIPDIDSLSILLYFTFGKTGTIFFPIIGEALLKTSPSGGARHPSEAYLILLQKNLNLPKGIYHYNVKKHGLELLKKKSYSSSISKIFYQLNHFPNFNPKAIIVITSLFERSMWRYREPRSFRAILFDIGHLIATARCTASALGYGAVVGDGFDDNMVKSALELSGHQEQPFTFIALT